MRNFSGDGFIGSVIADSPMLDGHSVRTFEQPRVEPFRKIKTSEQVEWIAGNFLGTHDVRKIVFISSGGTV